MTKPAEALVITSESEVFASDLEVVDGRAYVADSLAGLRIFDLTVDPPVELGGIDLGRAYSIHVASGVAYVSGLHGGLWLIDITAPEGPRVVFSLDISTATVQVVGSLAYVVDGVEGLRILDVSDPRNPLLLGVAADIGGASDIDVVDHLAYLSQGYTGMRIVDVSDPRNPVALGLFGNRGQTTSTEVSGNVAFVAAGGSLWVVDVSNPQLPLPVADFHVGQALDLRLIENRLHLALGHGGVRLLDVSDPREPLDLGHITTRGIARSLAITNERIHVGNDTALTIIDSTYSATPVLRARHPLPVSAGTVAHGIAYAASSREVYVIDACDPSRTELISQIPIYSADQVAVRDGTAFIVSRFDGFQTWDVHDPSEPVALSRSDLGTSSWALDLVLAGDFAFIAHDRGELVILDISNPAAPKIAGRFSGVGRPWQLDVRDRLAFVADGWDGVRVIDVSTPSEPKILHTIELIGQALGVAVHGDILYASTSGRVWTIDISSPSAPIILGGMGINSLGHGAGGVDLETRGSFLYANHNVFDISNPRIPRYLGSAPQGKSGFAVEDGVLYSFDQRLRVVELGPEYAPPRRVGLDISPGSAENRVRPDRPGLLRIALLGAKNFDSTRVDLSSLVFGQQRARAVERPRPAVGDLNRDARLDLIASFRVEETGIAFGDEVACAEGQTRDGYRFRGCDSVSTVGGCGLGFEGALTIAPLLLVRGRRRVGSRRYPLQRMR